MRRHEQAHHNVLKELDSEKLSHRRVIDELNKTINQLKEKPTSLENVQLEGDRQLTEKLEATLEGGVEKGKKPVGKPKMKKRKKPAKGQTTERVKGLIDNLGQTKEESDDGDDDEEGETLQLKRRRSADDVLEAGGSALKAGGSSQPVDERVTPQYMLSYYTRRNLAKPDLEHLNPMDAANFHNWFTKQKMEYELEEEMVIISKMGLDSLAKDQRKVRISIDGRIYIVTLRTNGTAMMAWELSASLLKSMPTPLELSNVSSP